jgi:small-conductance mechanosensitive channel
MSVIGLLGNVQVPDSAAQGSPGIPSVIPGVSAEIQWNIVLTVMVALLLVLARRGILTLVDRHVQDRALRYRWSKATAYGAFVVGVLILVQIWFTAIRSVGTFLGLLSAGVAIALKDLVADLAGWVFILWRRPFEPGDRIQIGPHAGDVVDTRIFAFTVMEIGNWVAADQSTGRLIHLPNQSVFTEPLANYTASFPFLWNELAVLVTFESDWRRAKSLLEAIAREEVGDVAADAERTLTQSSQRFLIHYRTLTPAVYTEVLDSGVNLTIRYLCHPRQRRGTAQTLWERILDAFAADESIDFAYPTKRVYFNAVEGKEGARVELPRGWSAPTGTGPGPDE